MMDGRSVIAAQVATVRVCGEDIPLWRGSLCSIGCIIRFGVVFSRCSYISVSCDSVSRCR